MTQFQGWTKIDEGKWIHDGCDQGSNELNIHIKNDVGFKGVGEHLSTAGAAQGHTYILTYTVNDEPTDYPKSIQVLSEHSSVQDAKKAASTVQRENPSTPPFADE